MTIEEMRRRYVDLRSRSGVLPKIFDAEAEKIARKLYRGPDHEEYREPVDLSPENWFNAAHVIVVGPCNKCGGTGITRSGRMYENEEGIIPMCFACRGKGWQSEADRRRNEAYEEERRKREEERDQRSGRRRRW